MNRQTTTFGEIPMIESLLMTGEPRMHAPHRSARLEGWKEFAGYLGKRERTAQRWEKEGMPIHREGGSVFAYEDDLDRWRKSRVVNPQVALDQAAQNVPAARLPQLPRFRSIGSILGVFAVFTVALLLAIAWRLWPEEVQVHTHRQLTYDGRRKDGGLFPDGRFVYFNEIVGDRSVVAYVPISGGQVSHLDLPIASSQVLAISPDRKSLLLSDLRSRQLSKFHLATRTLHSIPWVDDVAPSSAAWDPTGRRIAVSGDSLLAVFESWETARPLQMRMPGITRVSGWDPKGERLRFDVFDTKNGRTQWWELTGTGHAQPVQPFSRNDIELDGLWTSDGRLFVFRAAKAGASALSRIWVAEKSAVGASAIHPLTTDTLSWRHPTFVPGANIILAIAAESEGQLVTIPAAGHGATGNHLLPGVTAYELEFSRDGKWIAFTLYPQHTIWRCRVDGTEMLQLSPSGIEALQPHWSPDGMRIAFTGKRQTRRRR
jgi:Tol biopolymer transport system component